MVPLLLLHFQEPTTPAPAPTTPPAVVDLRQAPTIAEPTRLKLTPVLDGKLAEEEWDPFGESNGSKTFLQWEPRVLYVAATATTGKDLVVSIDPDSDGWLVGKNNLEARVTVKDGKPVVTVHFLDATNVAGPVWREVPGLSEASKAAIGTDGTIELAIVDPGLDLLPKKEGKLAARVDLVPTGSTFGEPNALRALAPLKAEDVRATALPSGLKAKVDGNERSAIPGEEAQIHFEFEGAPLPRRFAVRTEGLGRDATNANEVPLPAKAKESIGLDYRTGIAQDAPIGYRIARATITGADGVAAIVQASYRFAPLIDLELNDNRLKVSDKDRSVHLGFVAIGNTNRRVDGNVTITAPQNFRIPNGDDTQRLYLAEPRLPLRKGFDLFIPANATGVFPIVFSAKFGKQTVETVRYIVIE